MSDESRKRLTLGVLQSAYPNQQQFQELYATLTTSRTDGLFGAVGAAGPLGVAAP
jgi:hypothetical protein